MSTYLCACTGTSGYLASVYWYRSYPCYLYLFLSLLSVLSCTTCICVTLAAVKIQSDNMVAARAGWEEHPYIVSYNSEGVPGRGRCIVGVNVMIAAALATCMSCWCLYTSACLVLDLEMRDPERGKKLKEGELVSRIISTLATRIMDKKETNKMVQMESRFKQSEESSEYQPTFFQLPIK